MVLNNENEHFGGQKGLGSRTTIATSLNTDVSPWEAPSGSPSTPTTVISTRAIAISWLQPNEGLASEFFLALVIPVLPNVANVS